MPTRVWIPALVLVVGCAGTHRKPRTDLPPNERGVAELSALLEDFKRATAEHRFDEAEEILVELEQGVKDADMVTISHPDYSDVSAQADRARAALTRARREWAITQLIESTQAEAGAAEAAAKKLAESGPDDDTLERLDDALANLARLLNEGKGYRGDKRYLDAVLPVEQRHVDLGNRSRQTHWQLGAQRRLGKALDEVAGPPPPADAPLDTRIEHAGDRAEAFSRCAEIAAELEREVGFTPDLQLKTPIGLMQLADLALACAAKKLEAEKLGTAWRWQRTVTAIIARADKALLEVSTTKAPAPRLEAIDGAAKELERAGAELTAQLAVPGAEAGLLFASSLGKQTVAKLAELIAQQRVAFLAEQPLLRWRLALDELELRVAEAEGTLKEAEAEKNAEDKNEGLNEALGGMKECIERGDFLRGLRDPGWTGAKPAKAEMQSLDKLVGGCKTQAQRIQVLLTPKPSKTEPAKKSDKPAAPKSTRKKKR